MTVISPVLLRSCARGNQTACDIARRIKVMYAASILNFSDVDLKEDHDNKLPFTGTLLLTDVASDKPPHGSEGHRIYVSKQAAMEALPGIIGQAVNYQPSDLSSHASRHKVGVITKAWMEGNKVKVAGFIWSHDFPEAKALKGRKDLGMSMELSSVLVDDDEADVWRLSKFDFTGGTILLKKAAAYTKTDLAAVAAAAKDRGGKMPKHKEKDGKVAAAHKHKGGGTNLALMAQAIGAQLQSAVQNGFAPVLAEIKAGNAALQEGLEEVKGLHLIQAAAVNNNDDEDDSIVLNAAEEDASSSDMEASGSEASDEDEMDASASASDEEMEAAGKKGNADDDASASDSDSDASASESSDYQAMEDMGLEDASEEPGEVNKDASSKGSKTKVTKPPKRGEHFSGNVAKGRLHSAADKSKGKTMKAKATTTTIQAAALIGELQATVKGLKRQIKAQASEHNEHVGKLRKKLSRVTAQMERFAQLEGRRSAISHELVALGEKVGVDFDETRNNGQKYSVRAFDQILAAAEGQGIVLNPSQRIAMKMMAEEVGILDEGVVNRVGRA